MGNTIMENQTVAVQYVMHKKFFKLVGSSFKIFDTEGNLRYFVKQKAFKLREDIRIYSDESMSEELLLIKARNIIDFSSVYDVFDSKSGTKVGALKRRGLKSMLKDEWIIMDVSDIEVGRMKEDSALLAFLRRFLTSLIPQTFEGFIGESRVFSFNQKMNPFVLKMELHFFNNQELLDQKMGIAAAVLLGAIEGRQK